MSRLVVAVDGPSGSGKSSTARGVATRLGLRYLDTGAQFRAVTAWMLDRGVDTADPDAVAAHAELARIGRAAGAVVDDGVADQEVVARGRFGRAEEHTRGQD